MVRELQRPRRGARDSPRLFAAFVSFCLLVARASLADAAHPDAPATGDLHDLEDSRGDATEAPAPAPSAPAAPARSPERRLRGGLQEAEYPQGEPGSATETPDLAKPEAIGKNEHRHDGFFMRFGGGVTVAVRDSFPANGRASGTGFEMSFGGTPWTGVALGGGFMGTGIDSRLELISYFAFANYYPDPKNGLNFGALLGFSFLGNSNYLMGPSVAGAAGYEFWVGKQSSLGGLVRLGYTALSGTPRDTTGSGGRVNEDAVFLSLHGVWTWH